MVILEDGTTFKTPDCNGNYRVKSINTHSRNRIILTSDGKSIVDQSLANEHDINSIVANWKVTQQIPNHLIKQNLQYLNCTQVGSFQDVQDKIANAKSHFNQLPAEIRKLADNDFTKIDKVFENPNNLPILEKHGWVATTPHTPPEKTSTRPPEPLKNESGGQP